MADYLNRPTVSIVMPVYNAERYLVQAIQSILRQSFKDFELLIIDDGSTDSSLNIIKKNAALDKRIRYISHDKRGIGPTLNEGVVLARGKYIARMDADDISLPGRLAKQVAYLDNYPSCSALFTKVDLIDESGRVFAEWGPDIDNTTPSEIRRFMPVENCCAHPTLMIKAMILKQFGYDEHQVPSEDYDLWLRLLSNGKQLHKLDEKLLLYRMHEASVSQSSNRASSPQKKYLRAKRKFLLKQLSHFQFGRVEYNVLKSGLGLFAVMALRKTRFQLAKFIPTPIKKFGKACKSHLQKVVVLLRHLKAHLHILLNRVRLRLILIHGKNNGGARKRLLVIVPWMTIGGAEKVVLDLIKGLNARDYVVDCISTTFRSNEWASLYADHCENLIDLGRLAVEENKAWFIAKYVERNKIHRVITTNNLPGYQAAPMIKSRKKDTKIIDILHGQGGKREAGGWPLLSVPFDKYIDKRVVVTHYLKRYLVRKHEIDANKISVIHNGIEIIEGSSPEPAEEIKAHKDSFLVLWAGRFSYEKHPELVVKTAQITSRHTTKVHFIIVGDGEMKKELQEAVSNQGLNDSITISQQSYTNPRSYMRYVDALLMCSEMEGLPVVILEAFNNKLPVIAPKVGGIPEIVRDKESGYLINYSGRFAEQAAKKIIYLAEHKYTARNYGENGYKEVMTHFSVHKMVDSYAAVLDGLK